MIRLPKKKFLLTIFCVIIIVYCLINYNYIYSNNKFDKHSDEEIIKHALNNKPNVNKNEISNVLGASDNKNNNNNNNNNSNNKRLLAYDAGGFGSVQKGVITCRDGIEVEITDEQSRLADSDISYYHMQVPVKGKFNKPHYQMVFTLESEPHSYGGDSWDNADFRMWYNLDLSHPEPATYFDVKTHLADLLSPPIVEFEKKTDEAIIAWIVSNCNAFNGREKYMKRLMSNIKVDSMGGCLKNKFTHTADRMRGNIEVFTRYKFVIAIENSNCQDYITEKLVHAVASGSIPIVAGKDNKPDYLKFMPKNSYINLYDYKTPEELAARLIEISKNKTLYESHFPFKRHAYTKDYLNKLSLTEIVDIAKKIFNPSEKFLNELVAKEKSENKICKIARYLTKNDVTKINKEIEEKKRKRPSTAEACLFAGNLDADFNSPIQNDNNQEVIKSDVKKPVIISNEISNNIKNSSSLKVN